MFQNGGRGIGEKGRDNGLLVVVAVNDRRVRWSRLRARAVRHRRLCRPGARRDITPQFRQGNYGAGLVAGVQRIVGRIAQGRNVSLQDLPQRAAHGRGAGASGGGSPFFWLFIAFIVIRALVSGIGATRGAGRRSGGPAGAAGAAAWAVHRPARRLRRRRVRRRVWRRRRRVRRLWRRPQRRRRRGGGW
jgi:uncharacterized protein